MPLPVLTVAQMRAWEAETWATGQTAADVIARVGLQLARFAGARTQPGQRILILAGKGHNGDDARCAPPHLPDRAVQVIEVRQPAVDLAALTRALDSPPDLIIDGLFGIGLDRPLGPDWVAVIDRVNACAAPVLAVDVPSGLHADTGEPMGAAVRARWTLTLGAPKRGLLAPTAWEVVGRLEVEPEIGLCRLPLTCRSELEWTWPTDFRGFPPARPVAGHKGRFGHLGIVAGSPGYHGAAVLAARGAQRAQPGLITLFTHADTYVPIASQLQSVMVHVWRTDLAWPEGTTAVLAGPGLAARDLPADLPAAITRLWREWPGPVVVDASALVWLPAGPTPANHLRVMTPHPGEAARLLHLPVAEVQANRVAALRQLSQRYGQCWVVLKGHQTLVGQGSGPVGVNSSGNAELAQGGSGDVLAGYLAGFLAQPLLHADPGLALRYAVWQHGQTADRLAAQRPHGWTIEELGEELGR